MKAMHAEQIGTVGGSQLDDESRVLEPFGYSITLLIAHALSVVESDCAATLNCRFGVRTNAAVSASRRVDHFKVTGAQSGFFGFNGLLA